MSSRSLSPGHLPGLFPLAALILVLLAGCSTRRMVVVTDRYSLGDDLLTSVLYETQGTGRLLINLHEDERTSVEAGLYLIRKKGGRLLAFRQKGQRMLEFRLKDSSFRFDPNRVFTREGIQATLQRQGSASPEAVAEIERFVGEFLQEYSLEKASQIVTLHNNSDEAYSVLSYLPGAEYAGDAASVHHEPGKDPDDFFFVTDRRFFEHLRGKRFNVVLQDNQLVQDDGSLSVWAGRLGIPYINVEAQHGHLKEQRKMLAEALRMLARGYPETPSTK